MELLIAIATILVVLFPILAPIFLLSLAGFITEGIAYTRFTKIASVKYRWIWLILIWFPWTENWLKLDIMARLSKETETRMFCGKLVFKRKLNPILIYILLSSLTTVVSALGLTTVTIPIIGSISISLGTLASIPGLIWLSIINYVYLRDLLNTYRPDHPSNISTAIGITIGNPFTLGLLRGIYLLRLSKKANAIAKEVSAEEETVTDEKAGEIQECDTVQNT